MKKTILFGLILVLVSCKQKTEQEVIIEDPAPVEEKTISPLEAGEVFFKNKDPFGATIQLTGKQLIADTVIFKVSSTEMIVKENCLIVRNGGEQPFMRFSLPDMKFLGFSGRSGQGPDEFSDPHLVSTTDPSFLCYVFEGANQKLYRFEKDGRLDPYTFSFSSSRQKWYSDKALTNTGPDDFMYAETSATGKSIFRSTKEGDSIRTREVFNLGLNPKRKSWASYIGDFVVNAKQNRMAYAYKYFKMIKFMDLEAKTVRTINFEREEFDESTLYKVDGMDQNVTHYWGGCAGDEYVYFLYSGRTPVEVSRENSKKQYYIFVEQYDWNGNPIHKYRLDRWGYFTVDEKNKQIYLASTNDDDPFFVFQMTD